MGFMDSYKHLEKLCGDMFGDSRGVSAYIDAMLDNPRGQYLVAGGMRTLGGSSITDG